MDLKWLLMSLDHIFIGLEWYYAQIESLENFEKNDKKRLFFCVFSKKDAPSRGEPQKPALERTIHHGLKIFSPQVIMLLYEVFV